MSTDGGSHPSNRQIVCPFYTWKSTLFYWIGKPTSRRNQISIITPPIFSVPNGPLYTHKSHESRHTYISVTLNQYHLSKRYYTSCVLMRLQSMTLPLITLNQFSSSGALQTLLFVEMPVLCEGLFGLWATLYYSLAWVKYKLDLYTRYSQLFLKFILEIIFSRFF